MAWRTYDSGEGSITSRLSSSTARRRSRKRPTEKPPRSAEFGALRLYRGPPSFELIEGAGEAAAVARPDARHRHGALPTRPSVCCHSFHCDQPGGQIGREPYSASHSGHCDSTELAEDSTYRPV